MKTYLFLSAFFLLGATVFCQDLAMTTPRVLSAPSIFWEIQTVDLGSIEKGNPTTTNFIFTNNGNEALVIERVRTTCGCTASEYPKEPIAPGKTASIKVSYNAKSIGTFAKTITVYSNSVEPVSVLKIKGTVN